MKTMAYKPAFWTIGNERQEFLVDFCGGKDSSAAIWSKHPLRAMKWPDAFRGVVDEALKLVDRPGAFALPVFDIGEQWAVLWPDEDEGEGHATN